MINESFEKISLNDAKVRYDAQCKRVLSQKEILARILARTVKEFEGMTVDEIIPCMEGTPEISCIPVEAGKTNDNKLRTQRITGLSNEDAVLDEGVVYYDIRFYVNIPKSREVIRLIVNLEAQKSYYPGYEIVTRGIFYGTRMISAQLGTEFDHSKYNDIKKVYSIWICMDAPKKVGNAIAKYSIQKKDLLPGIPDKPEAYDKISVVLITLNEKTKTDDELLRMLNLLFSEEIDYQKKKRELEESYRLNVSSQLGEEMYLMCNLSDLVEERGVQRGIERGMQQGIEQMVRNLLKFGDMSDEKILKVAEISKEQLEQIKKSM